MGSEARGLCSLGVVPEALEIVPYNLDYLAAIELLPLIKRRTLASKTPRLRWAVGLAIVVSMTTAQLGCGSTAEGTPQALGNTTTKAAVVSALEGTGYKFRYRKVPNLEEYELVSGEAIQGREHIQFAVEIRKAGPFADITSSAEVNPQPLIVKYGAEEEGTVVGNVIYKTEAQAPKHVGKGVELIPSPAQIHMAVRVGVALRELFATKFRPGG
jgi:hypothetical protein